MESDPVHAAPKSDLPILSDRTFCCPGETSPVSAAIHLGRLASGWAACADCQWQNEASGTTQNISDRTQIRRTEFGIRGAYLNAIDRFRGAQLAAIFSSHLAAVHSEAVRLRNVRDSGTTDTNLTDAASPISVAVGYDGHVGAADVFSGVVSAVLQNGCNVVDAGRSSAASLLNVSRRYPHLCGSLLVTGAGGASGDIGLDAFDPHGQGIAVPWQKYGVSVRLQRSPSTESTTVEPQDDEFSLSMAVGNRLHDLRSQTPVETQGNLAAGESSTNDVTVLQLPELHGSAGAVFRAGRRSGSLSAVTSESFYEDWLLRWWPIHSRQPVRFISSDDQTERRLKWLTKNCSLNLEIHQSTNHVPTSSSDRRTSYEGTVTFELHEDDRFLTVRSRRQRDLSVDELVSWLNRCMPSTSAHLTAHASPCGRRVLLVDVAAPDTGHQQQVISDGLALAGWILTSMDDGTNPLPL